LQQNETKTIFEAMQAAQRVENEKLRE